MRTAVALALLVSVTTVATASALVPKAKNQAAHLQIELGSHAGPARRIAVDLADPAGLRPMQTVVLGEVQLQGAAASHIGQRVLVRFEHGHAPLVVQAARAGQQLLLRHFNPAG